DGKEEDTSYHNVADALSGVGNSITNVQHTLTEQINNVVKKVESESFVQQDKATHSLTIGAKTEDTTINIANKNGADRTLSGVKVAVKDNEAVNKGQLDESLKGLSNSLQSDDSAVVHYDKKDDENGTINYKSVTFGGKDKSPVGLHNIADGKISKGSHDAITGGQVNKIGEDVAKFLGGGTGFNNGTFTGPTYNLSKVDADGQVEKKSFNDIAQAFTGLDENIKNVNQRIKDVSENVAQDSLNWNEEKKAFVATHGEEGNKANSKITSLQYGNIAENSTDAITGGQLYSLGSDVAKYFGGGASYAEGTWTAPTFTVKTIKDDGETIEDKDYSSVAEAFAGISTSFTNIKNDITNVVSDSLVKWDEDTKSITIGKEKDDAKISIADKDSQSRTLSGLKAAEHNDEAVNKAQLDENVDKLTKDINDVRSVAVFYDTEEDTEEVSALTRSARKAKQNSVTFGDPSQGTVALRNVGSGKVTKDSTEAVNGSQLYSMGDTVAKYFGGGASYENGTWTAPKFTVKKFDAAGEATEENYDNVADAFAEISSSVTKIHNEVTNQIDKVVGDSLVKQDETTKVIKIGAETEGAGISFANRDGTDRTLSGVKAAENDNEAVNKAQLEKGLKDLSTSLQSDESAVVHYDKNTDENGTINYASVTFGKGKDSAAVGLHNVADGAISEGSHDVVNGGQINKISQDVAKFLGGEASFKDGVLTEPTYKLSKISPDGKEEDTSYHNVADALSGVGNSITNVQHTLT
ncbi:hypothetical protein ME1_00199, partial [Bartonella vinsonii subsp. arupensis OK-94-513]